MNPRLKNILAVLTGLVGGSVLNMVIITISGSIVPPPEGADVTTMEGLKASIHLFEPKHFVMPFLAHAMGTLLGAFLTAKVAATHHVRLAFVIGVFFLVGGAINVAMLPSPLWFNILDLAGAYLPMAFLGSKLAKSQHS
jgi:hypothetical protein